LSLGNTRYDSIGMRRTTTDMQEKGLNNDQGKKCCDYGGWNIQSFCAFKL